jgi:hypothetical protein
MCTPTLFDDDLEAVADRLDEIALTADSAQNLADSVRTREVIAMPHERST